MGEERAANLIRVNDRLLIAAAFPKAAALIADRGLNVVRLERPARSRRSMPGSRACRSGGSHHLPRRGALLARSLHGCLASTNGVEAAHDLIYSRLKCRERQGLVEKRARAGFSRIA